MKCMHSVGARHLEHIHAIFLRMIYCYVLYYCSRSGPENLKKSRPKKLVKSISRIFFFLCFPVSLREKKWYVLLKLHIFWSNLAFDSVKYTLNVESNLKKMPVLKSASPLIPCSHIKRSCNITQIKQTGVIKVVCQNTIVHIYLQAETTNWISRVFPQYIVY